MARAKGANSKQRRNAISRFRRKRPCVGGGVTIVLSAGNVFTGCRVI